MSSEAKESPWRPAEIIAAYCQVRDQFVGYLDIARRLLRHRLEFFHSFPGLIVQFAVDAAATLEAVQAP